MSRSLVRIALSLLIVAALAFIGAKTGVPIAALAAAFAQVLRVLPVA